MRAVYQLPPDSRHPQRRLMRAKWVLLVCRVCYAENYRDWGVTYLK